MRLIEWYLANRRPLPWHGANAYGVWVSEVMSQQTRIAVVVPKWEAWMTQFPDYQALATASESDVLAAWAGLGYYRRARNLRAGAQQIATQGEPTTAAEWRLVPGVGTYTAAAIASICQNEPVPCVDGNVARVYARMADDIASGSTLHRAAEAWSRSHMPSLAPGLWNQALMELGATICNPGEPDCFRCPVRAECAGVRRGPRHVATLPTPAFKEPPQRLHDEIWIPLRANGTVGIVRTPEGQWWHGMAGFPRTEAGQPVPVLRNLPHRSIGKFTHTVTRYFITVVVYLAEVPDDFPLAEFGTNPAWVSPESVEALGLPSPQKRALRLLIAAQPPLNL